MDGFLNRERAGRFATLFDMVESRSSSGDAVRWGPVIGADEDPRASQAGKAVWWGPVIGADEGGTTDGIIDTFSLSNCLAQDESTAPSDRRFKHDLQDAGTTVYGLPLYHYRYHGREGVYEGVMADDVLRVKPSAVSRDESGFLFVNYRSLGLELRRIA